MYNYCSTTLQRQFQKIAIHGMKHKVLFLYIFGFLHMGKRLIDTGISYNLYSLYTLVIAEFFGYNLQNGCIWHLLC